MAQIERDARYPHILMLYGTDVFTGDFRSTLAALPDTPVTLASHDFWVIHRINTDLEVNSSQCRIGESRLKICININGRDLSAVSVGGAATYMTDFLHELGHYWQVPPFSMRLGRTGTDLVRTRTTREFINAFFRSEQIPSLCLLAKEDSHWTYFMSAGATTYEAPDWIEIPASRAPLEGTSEEGGESENILREYQANPASATMSVSVGALGDVQITRPFHDLDLTLMGVLQPSEAYTNNNSVFYELVPQWISPVDFMSGICLVFAPDDIVQVGFSTGHNRVGIQRTGEPSDVIDIERFYPPTDIWNFDAHLAFRVIRRGSDYHFQVRKEFTRPGCLATILSALRLYTPPPAVDLFSDSATIPPADHNNIAGLDQWVTIRTINDQRAPIACGYMVKTWGDAPPLVDTHFTNFQIRDSGADRTISTVAAGDAALADYRSLLTDTSFLYHRPQQGPALLRDRGLANLIVGATVPDGAGGTMEVGNHDHWTGVDHAPKLLVRCPQGDFIAGGKVRLNRTAMAPHAGGAGPDMRLWGFRRERHIVRDGVPNLTLDATNAALQPDNSPYACAFILLARNRSEITDDMLTTLETYRLATSQAFSLATNNRRSISTTLA